MSPFGPVEEMARDVTLLEDVVADLADALRISHTVTLTHRDGPTLLLVRSRLADVLGSLARTQADLERLLHGMERAR